MNGYTTINILDMIDAVGEDEVNQILSDFSCSRNHENQIPPRRGGFCLLINRLTTGRKYAIM